MFSPALSQFLALEIIERYEAFVAARIDDLRPGADLVVERLRADLSEWQFVPLRGGLSVWATLANQASAAAFV